MSDEIAPVAVCVIEVPPGEQLDEGYPGYRYRQNLQLPPGEHYVYTGDGLTEEYAKVRAETLEEVRQLCRDLRDAWIEKYGESTAWDAGHCSAYAKAELEITRRLKCG